MTVTIDGKALEGVDAFLFLFAVAGVLFALIYGGWACANMAAWLYLRKRGHIVYRDGEYVLLKGEELPR